MNASKSQSDSPASSIEELSFEEAFITLEDIVSQLENEKHSLDQAMALFERGQALAHRCAFLLEQAELRVQQLTEDGLAPLDTL
jgi:exodeoxyribonuclease VII small subunit